MFQKFIKLTTAFALSTGFAVPAYAELSGTLRITSDMSNPAPRAVMEKWPPILTRCIRTLALI